MHYISLRTESARRISTNMVPIINGIVKLFFESFDIVLSHFGKLFEFDPQFSVYLLLSIATSSVWPSI